MENENQELRISFLRNFIDTIIMSISPQQEITEQKVEMPQKFEMPQNLEVIGGYMPSITEGNEIKIKEISPTMQMTEPRVALTTYPRAMPKPMIRPQMVNHNFQVPPSINLGKISQIFSDPGVSSIECPGPGKNVIVHKSGITQTTQVILNQTDIEEILKIISEKTKIPLGKGIFKAALENMLVTAVISEFVGTRFYIEKLRSPQVPYIR